MEDFNGADGARSGVGEPAAEEEAKDKTFEELGGREKSLTGLG